MDDPEVQIKPESHPQHQAGISQGDSLQGITLTLAIRALAERIAGLEEASKATPRGSSWPATSVEIIKIVLGGWPALGFIFLILFYSPLHDALNAIPEKVRAADEIGAFGVSLKSTIQREAIKIGAGNLSETIPSLSGNAIELLLHARTNEESLFSYHLNDDGIIEDFYFPSEKEVATLAELQQSGLVYLTVKRHPQEKVGGKELAEYLRNIEARHPGVNTTNRPDGRISRKLRPPLPKGTETPYIGWQLTDLGKKAVEVIVSSLAAELTGKGKPTRVKSPGGA